ncbi:hypothetical protein HYS95_00130 [Candidatus Daviesbacteria bacterium]|nr:hypothetical protein [Candidatus Daviesbacteria bacterium]
MLERFDLTKRLDVCTDFKVVPGFDEEFKERVREADPIVVFTHQTHADGVLASVVSAHLLDLIKESGREPQIKGFALTVASSLVKGRQSRVLQGFYYPISYLMSRKGLKTISYTRKADEDEYGMSREGNQNEIGVLKQALQRGYKLAVFAEGTVQAGRHRPGNNPENIFGMQEVKNATLINAARLTKEESGGRPIVYITVGLHGGFRIQSPNKEKLGPTKEGLATLFGVPEWLIPHVKGEATVGGIIPESVLEARFGANWIKKGRDKNSKSNGMNRELVGAVNRFIMEDAARFVPLHARGFYAAAVKEAVPV